MGGVVVRNPASCARRRPMRRTPRACGRSRDRGAVASPGVPRRWSTAGRVYRTSTLPAIRSGASGTAYSLVPAGMRGGAAGWSATRTRRRAAPRRIRRIPSRCSTARSISPRPLTAGSRSPNRRAGPPRACPDHREPAGRSKAPACCRRAARDSCARWGSRCHAGARVRAGSPPAARSGRAPQVCRRRPTSTRTDQSGIPDAAASADAPTRPRPSRRYSAAQQPRHRDPYYATYFRIPPRPPGPMMSSGTWLRHFARRPLHHVLLILKCAAVTSGRCRMLRSPECFGLAG